MPASRKRKRRDGTVVRFRPRARPTPAATADQRSDAVHRREDVQRPRNAVFAGVVGTTAHQEGLEDAVVRIVNAERARAGLPPLRTDERLRSAARAHCEDMARRDFCAHDNPDGLTPVDRMRAAGYPRPAAENVARGQDTPHKVMRDWMNSPGHRANVLNPDFATIGAGVCFLGPGGPCWAQNFGY